MWPTHRHVLPWWEESKQRFTNQTSEWNRVTDQTRSLYPEVIAAGSLSGAIDRELKSFDSSLRTMRLNELNIPFAYARVEFGSRFSQIYIAANERLFLFDCWNRGVILAKGSTPRLEELASAIVRWNRSEISIEDLAEEYEFVTPNEMARAYERGEEVETRWAMYLSKDWEDHRDLTEFVAEAASRPELRQLFPYTSMSYFCFSRCTGYPFTRDTPYVVTMSDGKYTVFAPSEEILGYGNGAEAAELVVKNLPPNCGPAVAGTADDFQNP
jgi:pyruvoyl-dependent arginine decarboxylase (PvlArgDC)